jgi:hypothetical protein
MFDLSFVYSHFCLTCLVTILGFTAWASTREPSHVFVLLESIYREFDHIAKKRRVFKVEVVVSSWNGYGVFRCHLCLIDKVNSVF